MEGVCRSGHSPPATPSPTEAEVRSRERRPRFTAGIVVRAMDRSTTRFGFALLGMALLCPALGCALQEVRGKSSFGPEYRDLGNGTDEVRYDARQGIELRWDKGITTGVTYRHRQVDNGSGDGEDLVMFEVGYPLWKASKKEDATAKRIEQLEKQVKELQTGGRGTSSLSPGVNGTDSERVADAKVLGDQSPSSKENNK